MSTATQPSPNRELLAFEQIISMLDGVAQAGLTKLDIFDSLNSTNQYLWEQNAPTGAVCLAEYQTAGRGQQGRRWVSPHASGLCLSLGWTFASVPQALSLTLGVGVVQVLETLGAKDVGLKWPNDVVWHGKKLAGLLVESRYVSGEWRLVIGLGMNVYPIECVVESEENSMPASIPQQVPTDLTEILGQTPSRNRVAAALITAFLEILTNYPKQGFAAYHKAWQRLDMLANQSVTVFSGNDSIAGIARGVDAQGALLLETMEGIQSFASASVRV